MVEAHLVVFLGEVLHADEVLVLDDFQLELRQKISDRYPEGDHVALDVFPMGLLLINSAVHQINFAVHLLIDSVVLLQINFVDLHLLNIVAHHQTNILVLHLFIFVVHHQINIEVHQIT